MKFVFILLGLLFIGIAYVGILLPGVPTTFPTLVALWFFSKSSRRLEHWVRYNKLFGRYIRDWETKRIYPKAGKIAMYVALVISNVIFYLQLSLIAFISFLILSLALLVWSLPYPENQEEYEDLQQKRRKKYRMRERLKKMFGSLT